MHREESHGSLHHGTYMAEEEGEDGSLGVGYGGPCLWRPWWDRIKDFQLYAEPLVLFEEDAYDHIWDF